MTQISYPYNPFNDNVNCIVTEAFTLTEDRNAYYPRAAPFFLENFALYKNATINSDGTITGTLLTVGSQYGTGNAFNEFIKKEQKNVFSSVVIPNAGTGQYVIVYGTVGGSFNLNEAAYAELAANTMNHDRIAYWEDLVDLPTEWPPEPHEHPINQVYTILDLMDKMDQLIFVQTNDPSSNGLAIIKQHVEADLAHAHQATSSDVQLGNVPNLPRAVVTDLNGNNPNVIITMDVLKAALSQFAAGTLNLN